MTNNIILNNKHSHFSFQVKKQLEDQGKDVYDLGVLHSLYAESKVPLPGHPLHNQHINWYKHMSGESLGDITPIRTPSKLYEFYHVREPIEYAVPDDEQGDEPPECGMKIYWPAKSLFTTCRRISERQPVTDLQILGLNCDNLTNVEVPIMSKNTRSLLLIQCNLPVYIVSSFVSNILRQLSDCITLQMLQLLQFSLQAEDLDKLLENIVSSHERELKLWFEFNNLPQEFKQKWIKRCKGNASIDLKFW